MSHRPSPNDQRETPPFTLEDLTGPRPDVAQSAELDAALSGQTVLVTGAAGSIGAALSEQLAALRPGRLVLVDVDEHGLYQLERRLEERLPEERLPEERHSEERHSEERRPARSHSPDGRSTESPLAIDCQLVDVSDPTGVERLFRQFRPDLVIHAAAYKHVHITERHPCRTFRVNTLSATYLTRACDRYDTGPLIFVSTDKAARPQGVLGATKRLAEWYVCSGASPVRRNVVRFGNVFRSRGSVVPLFEAQLASGAPLTVTHPEMRRYFMSKPEACLLILETLRLTSHHGYVFQMGAPVSILRLAESLANHYLGLGALQRGDAALSVVGVRPGEALREHLCGPGESLTPTGHPHIRGIDGPSGPCRQDLDDQIRRLCSAFQDPEIRPAEARALLFEALEALRPTEDTSMRASA